MIAKPPWVAVLQLGVVTDPSIACVIRYIDGMDEKLAEKATTARTATAGDYLDSLLLWIHERPNMYAQSVGELDTALWYLHMAWAKVADRETEYDSALHTAGMTPLGLISDDERHRPVDLNNEATTKVLSFWSAVDQILVLQVRVAGWRQ